MDEETIRLILDLGKSGADVRQVHEELVKLASSAREAAQGYDVLERATGTYHVQAMGVESDLDRLVRQANESTQAQKLMRQALDETAAATKRAGAAGTEAAGNKSAGGRGILGASYAIQDFISVLSMGGGIDALPRALMAVSNNVDQLAVASGMSVAQAAKLSIAFTGLTAVIPALIPLFKGLWDAMSGGAESGPKPALEALDAAEDRLKRIRAELTKIMNARPPGEEETAKMVEGVLGGGQGPAVVGAVAATLGATGRGEQMTVDEAKRHRDFSAQWKLIEEDNHQNTRLGREVRAELDAIQERLQKANVQRAGQLVGEAPTSRGARDTLRAIIRSNPGAFAAMPNLSERLSEVEPEAIARQNDEADAEEERVEAFADRARKGGRSRRARAQAQKKAHEEVQRRIKADDAQRWRDMEQQSHRAQARAKENEREAAKGTKAMQDKIKALALAARGHVSDQERGRREVMTKEAVRLQQRLSNPENYTNDRAEARDQQRLMGIMREFSAVGVNLNQAIRDLQRGSSNLRKDTQATIQSGQPMLNMGGPF